MRGSGTTGTTFRFILLLWLILISGIYWFQVLGVQRPESAVARDDACQIAAGLVDQPRSAVAQRMYATCIAWNGAMSGSFWYWTLSGILGFLTVAVVFYAVIPAWRRRRRGLVRLDVPEASGAGGSEDTLEKSSLEEHLARLRAAAGLSARRVCFLLDPYSRLPGGVVFGAFGRYSVILHAGQVVRRRSNPAEFDAVVRHELNHIKNGDVDWVYLIISIWRSFLTVVYVPTIAALGYSMLGVQSPALGVPVWSDGLRKIAVLGALLIVVSLTRADLLRTRELHADAMPGPGHIDLPGWLSAAGRRWSLLHDHPSVAVRAQALRDESALFRTAALPFLAAGAATTLAGTSLAAPNISLGLARTGLMTWAYWGLAGLLLCVVAVLIWNSATYAVEHRSAPPTGWREGVWLGTGLAVGDVISSLDTSESAFPQHPWSITIPILIALTICVWIAQTARLCGQLTRSHRWRTWLHWTGTAVTVIGFGGVCVGYLRWWTSSRLTEYGTVTGANGWSRLPWPLAHWLPAAIISATDPMAVLGPVLLWLIPTVAWMYRSVRHRRRRCPSTPQRSLWPVIVGVTSGPALLATAQTVVRHGHSWSAGWSTFDYTVYFGGLALAVIVSSAIVAALTAAIVSPPVVPYAVTVGGAAMLAGTLEATALVLADGCTGPLSLTTNGCPGPAALTEAVSRPAVAVGGPTLAFGLIVVVATAIATAGCREGLARRTARPPGGARPLGVSGSRADRDVRGSSCLAKTLAGTACAALVGLAASIAGPAVLRAGTTGSVTLGAESSADIGNRTHAWLQAGGMAAMSRVSAKLNEVWQDNKAVGQIPHITKKASAGETATIHQAIRVLFLGLIRDCRGLRDSSINAQRFIPLRDRTAESLRRRLLQQTSLLGSLCVQATTSLRPLDYGDLSLPAMSSQINRLYAQLEKIDPKLARSSARGPAIHPPLVVFPLQPPPQRDYMKILCDEWRTASDLASRATPESQWWTPKELSKDMRDMLVDLARPGSAVRDDARELQDMIKLAEKRLPSKPGAAQARRAIDTLLKLQWFSLDSRCDQWSNGHVY